MTENLKLCPFCGTQPTVEATAFFWPSSCYVKASVSCPKCKCVTDNSSVRQKAQVSQSVFWVDNEILKYVGDMPLYNEKCQFDLTTARAAKAKAREIVIGLWQQRSRG